METIKNVLKDRHASKIISLHNEGWNYEGISKKLWIENSHCVSDTYCEWVVIANQEVEKTKEVL